MWRRIRLNLVLFIATFIEDSVNDIAVSYEKQILMDT